MAPDKRIELHAGRARLAATEVARRKVLHSSSCMDGRIREDIRAVSAK
jgi:hypothetical protein